VDINMPDMDGLQATALVNKTVPTCAVIIMSVQNDADYMRRAMLAGARDFLTKPINMDELYNTIRTVYRNHDSIRRQYTAMENHQPLEMPGREAPKVGGDRAGHIITVYSPQGGVGTTSVAINLASGLMGENVRVLLVDADLQFGDVAAFLNLKANSSIANLAEDVNDLDIDLVEHIIMTHDSGLKVLAAPADPEDAEALREAPAATAAIVERIAERYDFVIVDTSTSMDEVNLNLFDRSSKIVLVGSPTLITVKNMRLVLDLFNRMEYGPGRIPLVLNRMVEDKKGRSGTFALDKIEGYLRHKVLATIPAVEERLLLNAINRGIPVIASDRDQTKPPIKQFLEMADLIRREFMGKGEDGEEDSDARKRTGLASFLSR
jgi:pilus assembly protein CpaE